MSSASNAANAPAAQIQLANLTPNGRQSGAVPAPQAQPPQSTSQLSGITVPNSASQPSVQSPSSPPAVHRATPSSSRHSFTLLSPQTWSTVSSSIRSSIATPFKVLGVEFDVDNSGGSAAWVLKITKLGAWFVILHLFLFFSGLFQLGSVIYSFFDNSDQESNTAIKAIQKIVTHSEQIDVRILNWMETSTAAEKAYREEEERRWEALLQVFKDCAASHKADGTSTVCNRVLEFFDNNATLPRPDNSALAKRNMAELDNIIRTDYLQLSPGVSPFERFWYPSQLQYASASTMIIFLLVLAVLIFFTVWQRFGSKLRRHFRRKVKIEDSDEGEKEDDSRTTSLISSGGEFAAETGSIAHRRAGHRSADPHSVAAKGNVDALKAFFDSDPTLEVDRIDQEYGTILCAAARSGSLLTVNYVLSRRCNVNAKGGRYHNALQAAAHSGNQAIVKRLLEENINETKIGSGGYYGSAINAAAEKGDLEMIQILFADDNALKALDLPGGTHGYPLIAATARLQNNIVQALLNRGADSGLANKTNTTALHVAASNGNIDALSLLINDKSGINLVSTTLGTPLHAACQEMHENIVLSLLDNGADPSIPNEQQKRTAAHIAASVKGSLPTALQKMLGMKPQLANATDADLNTPLHLASIAGNTRAVGILLDFNADCGIGDKFNAQPLFRAAGCDFPDIVQLLLKRGKADPNAKDVFGRTALHGPAQTTDVRVQEYLIKAGADVNAVGSDKKTPLHEACNMGRIKNVELLLNHPDIKINELDNDQFPPLYKALCSSDANPAYFNKCVDPAIVFLLLERDDLAVNASSSIAVQEAARKGFLEILKTMITKHNAIVQVHGGKYGSVLQAAAASGNPDLVDMLLQPEHHTNIDLTGGEYGCALSAAAAFGHVEILRRLLEAGANPNVVGAGRYGSPMQSICKGLEGADQKTRIARGEPIRALLREYGGREDESVEMPHEKFRWRLLPAGWSWIPPGEL